MLMYHMLVSCGKRTKTGRKRCAVGCKDMCSVQRPKDTWAISWLCIAYALETKNQMTASVTTLLATKTC